jgi:hypothetical protein
MTNNQTSWQELCVQLYAALEAHGTTWDDEALLDRVGVALRLARTEPEPKGPTELIRALELAEAALADIGDAEREPGDDLAWAEARAAQDLPRIRAVLARWGRPSIEPVPVSERPWEREGWCDGDGWCWCFDADGTDPWWSFDKPEGCPTWTHLLPHDALPLPVPTQHS